MKALFKLAVGVLVVMLLGSYIVATPVVSNMIQTEQKGADPLVSGARSVKQEVRTLTDSAHRAVYVEAAKSGAKKIVDVVNQLVETTKLLPEINNQKGSL